jgi:tetratricopeptide (TPR) repeat protein
MDSDDTIDETNGPKLRWWIRQATDSILGFVVRVHCPGKGENAEFDVTVVDHLKLFRNLPCLRFERRIHEQVLRFIREAKGEMADTDVFVVHSGYDHSPEGQAKKKERDLHLLHLEMKDNPKDPFTLFNLGMTHADFGEYKEAIDYLKRSIAHSGPNDSHLRKAYAMLAGCYNHCGEAEAAWQACEEGLSRLPSDVELKFLKAGLLYDRKRLEESARLYENVLQPDGERYLSSMLRGIKGFKTRQNLALVYADMGDSARAEEQWRQIVQEVPRYRPGWRGLGECLLKQGKHEDVTQLCERLLGDKKLRAEGMILQAELFTAKGDLKAARQELEQAVKDHSEDREAWQALCRFLFEHVSLAEAEPALKSLLRLDPEDARAYHNLGTVYLQQGRGEAAAEACRESLKRRPESAATYLLLGNVRCL